jgi:hypothetical protein
MEWYDKTGKVWQFMLNNGCYEISGRGMEDEEITKRRGRRSCEPSPPTVFLVCNDYSVLFRIVFESFGVPKTHIFHGRNVDISPRYCISYCNQSRGRYPIITTI